MNGTDWKICEQRVKDRTSVYTDGDIIAEYVVYSQELLEAAKNQMTDGTGDE